jgi:hypothetical protein
MPKLDNETLRAAAVDFLYLMDQDYPRSASLQLVGNRHNLDRVQRDLLHRGIFSRKQASRRRSRLVQPEQLINDSLLVDGHNVLITTESGLAGRPLIAANDGLLRDVAGISHRYRISSLTHKAIDCIFQIIHKYPPLETLFFLDAPIRQSGELAAILRSALSNWHLAGEARALKVPEKQFVGVEGIVASSDSAVVDGVEQGFDLAAAALKLLAKKPHIIDFMFLG